MMACHSHAAEEHSAQELDMSTKINPLAGKPETPSR